MWSLKIQGKVTIFLWRLCRGCLPTVAALASKQVNISSNCVWCHSEVESDRHVLFECGFARDVWANTGLQNHVMLLPSESCFDVIRCVFHACIRDQCALFGMLCWTLWNRRNKWVWDRVNGSVFGVKAATINLLYDWRRVWANDTRVARQGEMSVRNWRKPHADYFL